MFNFHTNVVNSDTDNSVIFINYMQNIFFKCIFVANHRRIYIVCILFTSFHRTKHSHMLHPVEQTEMLLPVNFHE